jgi:transcriptional regulator with XRE-family HTH domain
LAFGIAQDISVPMELTIKKLLMQELTTRQARNPSYSIRAFARDLEIGVATLSEVLGGKRNISKTNLEKVLEKLLVSPLEREKLWDEYRDKVNRPHEVDDKMLIDEDLFRLIADWHYLAVLNLSKVKGFNGNPEWIAQRLGIKASEAKESLERLMRLELFRKVRGRYVRTKKSLTTTRDIPSAAIRKHHSQNLLLAEQSLHRDPVEYREFGSVTLAVNLKKLPLAKELLLKTRKKIVDMLDKGETSEVYTLSFQLFPLTKLQTLMENNDD